MPEALDEIRARRPMPLGKACADDTLVALAMNGDVLPADHGFPARLVVSGRLGAAHPVRVEPPTTIQVLSRAAASGGCP
jgi:DMSO/TMAO reductase YedYZ molybdopterin-dependent catalytic subunit